MKQESKTEKKVVSFFAALVRSFINAGLTWAAWNYLVRFTFNAPVLGYWAAWGIRLIVWQFVMLFRPDMDSDKE